MSTNLNLHPIFSNIFRRAFPSLDLTQSAPSEEWECSNCYHIGPLDERGRCQQCGSSAVISQEVYR